VVYPHPWMNFNSNKSRLPLLLRAAGVPAAPTVDVTFGAAATAARDDSAQRRAEATRLAKLTIERVHSAGWEKAFVKPHESSFMDNVDSITPGNRMDEKRLIGLIDDLIRLGKPGLAAQRYVPSFKHNWERRMHFVGGRFATGVANKVDAARFSRRQAEYFHWESYDIDGGALDTSFMPAALIPLARKALKAVVDAKPTHVELPDHPPLVRIDCGCCLEEEDYPVADTVAGSGGAPDDAPRGSADRWFVNEMEWSPDSCLTYFTRLLVSSIDTEPPYAEDTRMTQMVQRAAAAWYPLTEHIGLEFARFAVKAAASRHRASAGGTPKQEL
jgi:hypothetical protein